MPSILIKTALVLSPFLVFAVNANDQTLKDKFPIEQLKKDGDQFITLTTENDFFGGGTDENYTNGLRITLFDINTKLPGYAKKVASFIPTFDINETTSTYASFGHNLYTPEDISLKNPDPEDRPYASFLYLSAGLTSITGNHIDDMEITLGVVGPAALGEEVQRNWHKLINSTDPKGWDSQLNNEIGLIVSWERRWPTVFSGNLNEQLYFRFTPHLGASIGNIYTYANTGLSFQVMPKQDIWQSLPIRVRPAIPGNGFFSTYGQKWSWMLFAGIDSRAVARNIFLDGNSFSDSASVDKYSFVHDANAGFAINYDRIRLSFAMNIRSKEFNDDDDFHKFGTLSIGYKF